MAILNLKKYRNQELKKKTKQEIRLAEKQGNHGGGTDVVHVLEVRASTLLTRESNNYEREIRLFIMMSGKLLNS